jgi:hypothetical protein
MIRSTVKIDRRRKPTPTWEPPRDSSTIQRNAESLRIAASLQKEPTRV